MAGPVGRLLDLPIRRNDTHGRHQNDASAGGSDTLIGQTYVIE
jgi:hypothetical protein